MKCFIYFYVLCYAIRNIQSKILLSEFHYKLQAKTQCNAHKILCAGNVLAKA